MKIQLKDVLPGELFWVSAGYHATGHIEDAVIKILPVGKVPMYVQNGSILLNSGLPHEVWLNRKEVPKEPAQTLVLEFPNEQVVAIPVIRATPHSYRILPAESEVRLLDILLKRAGKVAVTEQEAKENVALREFCKIPPATPKRELPPIEELKPFEKKETEEEFAERHRVKAVDVPVGMTFYTNYNDFNLDIEGMSMTMRKNLHYLHNGYGLESETPLTSEFVYVRHPEECKPKVRTARPGEKEINWGEDAPEDMFVHVGSKDRPDGSREDIYELYSEEKHGDVETWTRAMVLSMNDHMPGRDKAIIRESKPVVRTEKEIRMEILDLTVELLSVMSGSSKEEIIDRYLDRAKKDEMVRKMDDPEKMIDYGKTVFAKVDAFLKERGYSGAADDWIGAFRKAKRLKTTMAQTTEIVGNDWRVFVNWFESEYPSIKG